MEPIAEEQDEDEELRQYELQMQEQLRQQLEGGDPFDELNGHFDFPGSGFHGLF